MIIVYTLIDYGDEFIIPSPYARTAMGPAPKSPITHERNDACVAEHRGRMLDLTKRS